VALVAMSVVTVRSLLGSMMKEATQAQVVRMATQLYKGWRP